jgi:hypothetical protein
MPGVQYNDESYQFDKTSPLSRLQLETDFGARLLSILLGRADRDDVTLLALTLDWAREGTRDAAKDAAAVVVREVGAPVLKPNYITC